MKPFYGFNHIHLLGIGGSGMSSLALFLKDSGFEVSGSDSRHSDMLEYLGRKGIQVSVGHSEQALYPADIVIHTSAIAKGHPVLRKAAELKKPVIKRAAMLGEIMKKYWSVSVCGSHGKTSTALMLSSIWNRTENPAALIGGGVEQGRSSGAHIADSGFLIVEADEYDRSFLSMWPSFIVMTNIDDDHLDTYGDLASVRRAFLEFANRTPSFGVIVANADDKQIRSILPEFQSRVITYGSEREADYTAEITAISATGTSFDVYKNRKKMARINIRPVGAHFVSNALGAFAMAHNLGVPIQAISTGLSEFKGAKRRLEFKGCANRVALYDDYAHHPTEVGATVASLKKMTSQPVKVIFQPHLYSRTQMMAQRFAQALSACDEIFILPVYAAREAPISGVEGDIIVRAAGKSEQGKSFHFLPDSGDALQFIVSRLNPGDVCITMGAGDVSDWGPRILEELGDTSE